LKELDDIGGGVPPQIVGGDAADAETFVIGDDDLEEDGFEYIHDVEAMTPSSNSGSPPSTSAIVSDQGLRGTANAPHTHSNWSQGGAAPDLMSFDIPDDIPCRQRST